MGHITKKCFDLKVVPCSQIHLAFPLKKVSESAYYIQTSTRKIITQSINLDNYLCKHIKLAVFVISGLAFSICKPRAFIL